MRADHLVPNCLAVPIMYSFVCGGLMPGTNNLPADDLTGSTPNRLPLASKYALSVCSRPRSQEAARASEFAAGLYLAMLAKTVSVPLYAHVAPSRGWMVCLYGTLCISYFVPGDLTKPATLSAVARP